MIFNLFNKTKNLDKLYNLYIEQYSNIEEALEKFYKEESNLEYKHGVKMFGNVKDVLEQQINDGIEDIRTKFNHIFEIEFTKLKHENPKSLAKWVSSKEIAPVLKFASDDFLDANYDFIVDNFGVQTISLDDVEIHPIIKELIKSKKIRNKYFNQIKILDKMKNSKNKPLLLKANEKSLVILKEKEKYAKKFLEDFNSFIHRNIIFKTYDFDIDFENKDFNEKAFEEAVVFFSIIIFLLENKVIGLHQSHKVFLNKNDLNNFNLDENYWFDKFKPFGIEIIDLEI